MMKRLPVRAFLSVCLVGLSTALLALACDSQRTYDKAMEAYLKKDYRAAEKQLRSLTKADPDYAFGHLYLGHSLYFQRKFKEAIPEYEKAMELGTKSGEINQSLERILTDQLGMSYGISGQLERAKVIFEQASKKDPEYPIYYYNLACAYAELGNLDEAIAELKKGFERKQNMLKAFPNPRSDDSFKRYLGNPEFETALKEIGVFPGDNRPASRAAQPAAASQSTLKSAAGQPTSIAQGGNPPPGSGAPDRPGFAVVTERKKPLFPLSSPWVGLVSLAIIVACVARRAEPIGGFLLYYLAVLIFGLFWGALAMVPQQNPYALEGDTKSYAWSLGLLIPLIVLRFVESMVLLYGFLAGARTRGVIFRVKVVLWLQALVSSLSVVAHALFFPRFIPMDVIILASTAFWLTYLSRSKRVARVFVKD